MAGTRPRRAAAVRGFEGHVEEGREGLAAKLEAKAERQRFGQEPVDLEDGGGTVDELMGWWIDKSLQRPSAANPT